MAIEVPPQVSRFTSAKVESTKRVTKQVLRFLSRVFKPGGWRYLRPPVEPEQQPERRAEHQPEQEEATVKRRKAA